MHRRPSLVALAAVLLLLPRIACAQDIGHKLLGSVGLDAGTQIDSGSYLADRFIYYGANTLRDRAGESVPLGLDLDAYAAVFGAANVVELGRSVFYTTSIGVPFTTISTSTSEPRARIDRWGLGDIALMPFKLGWRGPHLDVVASFSLSAPARTFGEPPLGTSQWSEQLSLGNTVFFTNDRAWRLSVLATYDLFQPKRGADVTRGDTISVQGGAGTTLGKALDLGVVGYALWQVRDNRGTDLPPILSDATDRVFGLGAEIGAVIPSFRSKLTLRWVHDLGAESRPEGQIVIVAMSAVLHRSAPPRLVSP